jgi:hypothetical protein
MLTESQKSIARFNGGQDQTNRRRHLRQLRTSLFNVRSDAALQPADHASIAQTLRVLDRLLAEVQSDLAAAKNIKRDWDKHVSMAYTLLDAIPLAGVADVIALGELARELGSPRLLLEDIGHFGWHYKAGSIMNESLATLSRRCASDQKDPTEFAASVRAAMPAAAAKHADLIRQITTLAVAQQMEASARQPQGGTR